MNQTGFSRRPSDDWHIPKNSHVDDGLIQLSESDSEIVELSKEEHFDKKQKPEMMRKPQQKEVFTLFTFIHINSIDR